MEFLNIRDSREPMMLPLSKLLFAVAQDEQTRRETLKLVKPLLEKVFITIYLIRCTVFAQRPVHGPQYWSSKIFLKWFVKFFWSQTR
jgi:hypothetical protein